MEQPVESSQVIKKYLQMPEVRSRATQRETAECSAGTPQGHSSFAGGISSFSGMRKDIPPHTCPHGRYAAHVAAGASTPCTKGGGDACPYRTAAKRAPCFAPAMQTSEQPGRRTRLHLTPLPCPALPLAMRSFTFPCPYLPCDLAFFAAAFSGKEKFHHDLCITQGHDTLSCNA